MADPGLTGAPGGAGGEVLVGFTAPDGAGASRRRQDSTLVFRAWPMGSPGPRASEAGRWRPTPSPCGAGGCSCVGACDT